jgi:hypothetical protein
VAGRQKSTNGQNGLVLGAGYENRRSLRLNGSVIITPQKI